MRYKKIAEIADVVTGGTPSTSKSEYWDGGTIPWLQSGCCQNCDVLSTEKYITKSGYDNSSAKMMVPDTVMIALTGATAGKVGYLKFAACGNQSITGILPSERINSRFLFYYLISKREHILADCIGGAQPHISQGYVKNILIPDISLEEQEKVVTELEKVSLIIREREKQIKLFDELIKARFVEMFGDENNSKNLPVIKIQDVADVQVGVVIKPAQYYTDEANGTKAFRSLNIGEMHIKDSDWVFFNDEGQKKNSKSILRANDLVIVRSGAPGTACVITKEYEGANAIDVIIAHPDMDKVNPLYLCAFTNYPHGKRQINEGTGGAAQQHFNVGKYKEMDLIYPPKHEQDEFVAFVKQVDKSKVEVQKTLEKTQLLFNSLMQGYFGT